MSRLNVGLVTFEFPPFHWMGGEGRYTAGLHDSLLKLGHNVTTLIPDLEVRDSSRRSDLIFVPTINARPFKLLSFYLRANARVREIAKDNGAIDVVHYTNDYGLLVLSEKDIHRPVVVTMHHPYMAERGILRGLGYRDPTYFFTILSKFKSAQVACRKATKIVAVSRFTARGVVKGYGIPPEKITVVPDAVDTSRFNPCVSGLETREQWKLDSEPVIVFVGRVAQNKGLDVLLKAFKNLIQDIPDAKLFIIGEETKTYARARPNETVLEGLRRMVIEFNLTKSVRFLGKAPEESLPKIYATADVIVLPSLLEGFGMTLLEAMATAKPCVATRVGGVPEVVMDGETGLLVPPGDSVALQRAMSTVLDDRLLSRRLGQAGRQRVESKFALDIVTKEMVGVYQRTLEKSQ